MSDSYIFSNVYIQSEQQRIRRPSLENKNSLRSLFYMVNIFWNYIIKYSINEY